MLYLIDFKMVPGERLELSRGYPHQILSLARLPVPPPRQVGSASLIEMLFLASSEPN